MRTYIGQRRDQQLLGPDGRGGQVYRYSNGGFIAIRGIVQAMTGAASYEDWVVQNVLTPIGVNGRSAYLPDPGRRYDIRYYQRTLVPARGDPPGTIPHEASWNSCAADMGRLLAALRGTSLLNAASMQTMLTPYPLPYRYDYATKERRPYGGWISLGFTPAGRVRDPGCRKTAPIPTIRRRRSCASKTRRSMCRFRPTPTLPSTLSPAALIARASGPRR